ncbi:MAG: hypothetical protein LBQ68_00420 [Clostridiales bacterium]|jgi:hypothetical protein|nr:hypothetical protein [Clostridiales bacterium]
MKTLTVTTDAYFDELIEATGNFARRVIKPHLFYVKLYYDMFDASKFYALLDRIAFDENPALSGTPGLSVLTRNSVKPEIREKNVLELREYVASHRVIHLEGYVRFRMAEYNYYLSCVMYAIIKKLRVDLIL